MKEQIRNRCVCVNLAIMTVLVAGPSARAEVPPGYEIIKITDDGLLDFVPSINSCGVVAWMRQLDSRRESAEIFTYDDATGLITQITDDNIRDISPAINDDGTIVWARGEGRDGAAEIAMWRDGELTILTNNTYNDGAPSINNLGHVAWRGEAGTGCSERDIFFFDGERIQRITRNNGFCNQGPRINDRDEIVWTGFDFCHNPWIGHILLYVDGDVTQLNEGAQQEQSPDINNRSQVVWGTAMQEIMIWEKGQTRRLFDNAVLAHLNERQNATFLRFDAQRTTWDQWLWLDGQFFALTDEPEWNTDGEINRHTEVAWIHGLFPRTDIQLLRRCRGDSNADGLVDAQDFTAFIDCLSGAGVSYADCDCRFLDFDRDQDVDLQDFAALQEAFSSLP